MNNLTLPKNSTFAGRSVYIQYHQSLVIWTVLVLVINVLGAILNGLIFTVTLTYRPLRKSSSCPLLAHCILLDSFLTIISQTGAVLVTYLGDRPFPPYFCQVWGVFIFVPFFCSNWAHTVLAVTRYTASGFPHFYRRLMVRPKCINIVAIIVPWLVSVVLNVFPVAGVGLKYSLMQPWAGCMGAPISSLAQSLITAFGTYIPCLLIGVCYTTVLVRAKVDMRRRVNEVSRASVLEQRYDVAKMLFACFLWYCISNFTLPAATAFFPHLYFASPLTQLALKGLQYVSSAVSPIFCVAVSKNYRKGVRALVTCNTVGVSGAEMDTKKWGKTSAVQPEDISLGQTAYSRAGPGRSVDY